MKECTPREMYDLRVLKWIPYHVDKIKTDLLSACGYLYYEYRKLAVLEWNLNKDAYKFTKCIKESVNYSVKQMQTILTVNPNATRYQSEFTLVFDALCTGEELFAKETSLFVDDNTDYHKKPSSHPADWLYRCIVALVLERNTDQWDMFLEKLKKGYSVQKRLKLYPYALLLEAIWNKDTALFHEQIRIVADTHMKLTRSIFDDYEDKLLCLWGIALCNLARMKGMKIEFDHPLIPKELIS
jgi:hypothetical protein